MESPAVPQDGRLKIRREELLQRPELLQQALSYAVLANDKDGVELLLPLYLQGQAPRDELLVTLAQAVLARAEGDYRRAVALYRAALETDSDLPTVRLALAQSLFENRADKAARQELERFRQTPDLAPEYAQISEQYAQALDKRDRWTFGGIVSYLRDGNVNNAPHQREYRTRRGVGASIWAAKANGIGTTTATTTTTPALLLDLPIKPPAPKPPSPRILNAAGTAHTLIRANTACVPKGNIGLPRATKSWAHLNWAGNATTAAAGWTAANTLPPPPGCSRAAPTNISASAQMAHANRRKTPPNPTPAKDCASAGRNNGRPGSPHPPISASAAAVTMPQTGSAFCAETANFPPACPCRTAKSNLPASPRKSSACGNVSAATIFSIPTAKATCLSSLAGYFEMQAAFWGVKTEGWKLCSVYMVV